MRGIEPPRGINPTRLNLAVCQFRHIRVSGKVRPTVIADKPGRPASETAGYPSQTGTSTLLIRDLPSPSGPKKSSSTAVNRA